LEIKKSNSRSVTYIKKNRTLRSLDHRRQRSPRHKLQSVITYTHSPLLRLNAICPYYTMFPLKFPLQRLAKAKKEDWVLDPFCGRGTTVFAARLLGLGCVGIDSNPIAAAIAAAKLADTKAKAVVDLASSIVEQTKIPAEMPEGDFWRLCFHPKTLQEICGLREELMKRCVTHEEIILRALLLGILHGPLQKWKPTYLSNQMPRTYATKPAGAIRFWEKKGLITPAYVDTIDAISRRAAHLLNVSPPLSKGSVYLGDSREAHRLLPKGRKFSWVITSPPYFGMRTYRPDQWLRNWFLGGKDNVDYNQTGQLSHHADHFVEELASVWKAISAHCVPGSRLIVRFGYLPSIPLNARNLICSSLNLADVGWRVYRWVDAGSASNGKRQSEQFGFCKGTAARELDVYARLEA
jgi:DNA modification methylase